MLAHLPRDASTQEERLRDYPMDRDIKVGEQQSTKSSRDS
jgi:hypothetical protein